MTVRIRVDLDLCQGHGVCESEAPEVFEVGKDHKVRVLNETPDEGLLGGIRLAVKYCPTHAISLDETDHKQGEP
ncbi:MAG: ferredoxin [Microthrixaceae bacterium]